jgi:hypothetical protein
MKNDESGDRAWLRFVICHLAFVIPPALTPPEYPFAQPA